MLVFDKTEIRESLTVADVFDMLMEWGAEPVQSSFGIICSTICHNRPGEGSKKLYYYSNTGLFKCYTGCENSIFDIFELLTKVKYIQENVDYDLNDAVRWVAQRVGYIGVESTDSDQDKLDDWKVFSNYERLQEIENNTQEVILKEYDDCILSRFNYNVLLKPWLEEGISQEVIEHCKIGYYPGGDQITIPHFDAVGRFVGLRGRTLCEEDGKYYGKYRPLNINKILYSHPLGMNLYNLNNSINNIKIIKKAIVFESEKSTLQYQSYFGIDNDISVACCGSSISSYQIQLLLNAGVEEVVIAFDRQFEAVGDSDFNRLKNNLLRLRNKYKNYANISFIFDKDMITNYKASPTDEGPEKFLQLFQNRIVL